MIIPPRILSTAKHSFLAVSKFSVPLSLDSLTVCFVVGNLEVCSTWHLLGFLDEQICFHLFENC